MKTRFTEEQVMGLSNEAEAGVALNELCRNLAFGDAEFHSWRTSFRGTMIEESKRLWPLEQENKRLKRSLAEMLLDA